MVYCCNLHGFNISRSRVINKIVKRRFVTNVTKTVTNHSNRVAVIDSNGSFSYEQIYDQAQLIASRLDAKPGDRFCFLVESGSGQGLMDLSCT